jgi:hypothetical protein
MIYMNDIIARLQIPEIGNEKMPVRRFGFPGPRSHIRFVKKVRTCQNAQINSRQIIAGMEIPYGYENIAVRAPVSIRLLNPVETEAGGNLILFQNVVQALRAAQVGEYKSETLA